MSDAPDYRISPSTYQWSVRLFTWLRKVLEVNVKLHGGADALARGDLFLFNHFARFETFIPQYLIYRETGAFCRSVAAHELFAGDDAFAAYLRAVGAVPNDHPALLPFLAAEILRGRKVVVFPEGGMVKDRRVIDERGDYGVYSRAARERRKHHTGAAVLALALETFKAAVRRAESRGAMRRIEEWTAALALDDPGALLAQARRPTRIVPANITFYPIRVDDNLLRRGAELLGGGRLSRRATEELLVEGNLLLERTDMDIRLGAPIEPEHAPRWIDRRLLDAALAGVGSLEECFELDADSRGLASRALGRRLRRRAQVVRDSYMHRMYEAVTVNLSHLAARILFALLDAGDRATPAARLHRHLYLTVKLLQREAHVHLHRSLRDPRAYAGLLEGRCEGLDQLVGTVTGAGLVAREHEEYRLLDKLAREHAFDAIRIENPLAVYANEVAPIPAVHRAVGRARGMLDGAGARELAELRFDDECIGYRFDRTEFSRPRHHAVNERETATEPGDPYLLVPDRPRPLAVVLVHGFLASPAELRSLGERLHAHDFAVMGVRLDGHGTSPWDLRERGWADWLESVRRGLAIALGHAPRACVVGFSTGGALALRLAAERPPALAGVVAACVPMRFRNPSMKFVPLVHGANRIARWMWASEGVMPFRPNVSEHPHINYYNMPVRGLWELTRLVGELDRRLPDVECPVALLQGSDDPVVVPESVHMIAERLERTEPTVRVIESSRHGIVNEDVGGTQAEIVRVVESMAEEAPSTEALVA